ncbi:EAL domain-containing protein [Paenibacillus baekrokdamisoli]|nr:EAL domain-containing protein [Paenibacillus baekrokdamisoli]
MDRYGVLIVDDSSLMRQMAMALFEQDSQFFIAGTAKNGLDALDCIVEFRPDLVVIDVEMPEMDGLTALHFIMNHCPVPVVMLSSYTSEGSMQTIQAMRMGAADYFHKDILFQKPVNDLMTEEFLQRCKIAIKNGVHGFFGTVASSKEMAVKVLLEWINYSVKMEEDLRIAQQEFRKTLSQQNGMVFKFIEEQGRFLHTSCEGELLFRMGLKPEQIVDKELHDFYPAQIAEHHWIHYSKSWSQQRVIRYQTEWKSLSYLTVLRPVVRDGKVIEVMSLSVDITEQRRTEEHMNYLANHDQLTGLPNRKFFSEFLRQTLDQAQSASNSFAVLYVGLDHFKLINDTLGHDTGDWLLQIISRRLERSIQGRRRVARVGGDTYLLMLPLNSPEGIATTAEQILSIVKAPILLNGQEIHTSVSMGISRFPHDATEVESLIAAAEMAMYNAKEQASSSYQFYSRKMNERFHKRMELENHLRKAIENEELRLLYQPVVDSYTGQIVGLESLLRWHNPHLGHVPPSDFIPVAEETGLILEIGEWVLKEACKQNKIWQVAGLPKMFISVNLSSRQFNDSRLSRTIQQILEETELLPQYLELEITESMTMDVRVALDTLYELKKLGVQIAMDDFGTGYSSLGYLKDYPIDKMKIDQSFIKGLQHNQVNAAIVNTMIAMAHNLGLQVVAEGVETEEELHLLKDYGCGLLQGYYFSPPTDVERIVELITP